MSNFLLKAGLILGAGAALGGSIALWSAYGTKVFAALVLLGVMPCM